jgi:hypothetical protein
MLTADRDNHIQDWQFCPGKPWSLWDIMFNFQIGLLLTVLEGLRNEELNGDAVIAAHEMAKAVAATKGTVIEPFRKISDQDRARVESLLKAVVRVADSLKAQEIINRAESFLNKLRRPPMYLMDLVFKSRALRETVEHAVHYRRG